MRKGQPVAKFEFVRTLHPYPIPDEEGDEGSLITGSGIGDLSWYSYGSFKWILLSEWKSKNNFQLAEEPSKVVSSRKM